MEADAAQAAANQIKEQMDGLMRSVRKMAADKKSLDTDAVMLVLAREERSFDQKDVETAIEAVKQELTKKEAEAKERKEELERKNQKPEKPESEGTGESSQKPEAGSGSGSGSALIPEETKALLRLAPRLLEVIIDMWDTAGLNAGWETVDAKVLEKYGSRLTQLSRNVYSHFLKTKSSEEGLKELIRTHTPHKTEAKADAQPEKINDEVANSSSKQSLGEGGAGSGSGNGPVGAPQSPAQTAAKPPPTELDLFMKKLDNRLGVEDSAYVTALISPNANFRYPTYFTEKV